LKPDKVARLRDVVDAWASIEADPKFADDLAAVGAAEGAAPAAPETR
jgi:hypothetical protein